MTCAARLPRLARTGRRFPLPLLLAAVFLPRSPLAAQDAAGRIVGRVIDAAQGGPVSGATVELVGLAAPMKTTSALNGRFAFGDVPAGEVGIRVRMIGYGPKLVTGVKVPAGGTVAQEVALNAAMVQLDEINVTVEAERGSVTRALETQRNAPNIVSSVTAEQIAKSPDGDAGQAVQRVSGVTVQDGKYLLVRGLGERYTTTALNGARIPSPEPERKVVPLDLFPAGLLEGITTSKTFTPDQPGDFSGASVDLRTREFPSRRVITFSTSTGINTAASGKQIIKAPTLGREWLGFGGGARELPAMVQQAGDLRNVTEEQGNAIIASFRNAWNARSASGTPNGSLGLSLGGEDPIGGLRLGYVGSFSYSYGQEIRANETKGLAASGSTPGTAIPFNTYHGMTGRGSVLWGGLLNLSARLGGTSRITLNNTYTRSADNEASQLTGENEEFAQQFQFTRLTFIERSVRSSQLVGEHLFGNRHLFNWSVTSSGVTRDEPDRSDLGYLVRPDSAGQLVPYEWFGQSRFATRTFSSLSEHGWDLGGGYQLALGRISRPAIFKVGGAYRTVERASDSRAYDIVNRTLTEAELQDDAERIFDGRYARDGRLLLRANAFGGRYTASDKVGAGYAMLELPVGGRVKVIGGARVERWNLEVNTLTIQGLEVPARPRTTDLLPSLALNFSLGDNQNLRLSASRTLSRPEYRELSPVPYFEQVGLLVTFGNPALRRALIQNYDARWEWFPAPGEVLSVAFFGKRFTAPVEKIIILQAGAPALSFVNAKGANNYGVELELRKNLGVIGLLPFTLFTNSTLMRSRIEPGSEVLTNAKRPMVGQSGYVVNAGLTYASATGRLSATALYNVTGRRIAEAGASGLPDTYEEARNQLDVSLQAPLVSRVSVKLDGKNLLDAPYHFVQGGVDRHRYTVGRVFGVGLSWKP